MECSVLPATGAEQWIGRLLIVEKEVLMAIVLGLLILVSAFQTVQLVGISSSLNRMYVGSLVGSMASSGETYDEMMARMHGGEPSAQGLGGC
jgi:hypothetical protein